MLSSDLSTLQEGVVYHSFNSKQTTPTGDITLDYLSNAKPIAATTLQGYICDLYKSNTSDNNFTVRVKNINGTAIANTWVDIIVAYFKWTY